MRSLDLGRAVAGKVAIAEVVGKDHDDVRFRPRGGSTARNGEEQPSGQDSRQNGTPAASSIIDKHLIVGHDTNYR